MTPPRHPTPRPRPTLRWSLTLLSVLLTGALITSLRYHVTIREPNTWRLEISGGAIKLNWDTSRGTAAPGPTQYDGGRHSAPFEPWPRPWRRVGWPGFILPIWTLTLITAVPALYLWARRPKPPHLCPGCAYDLRGLPQSSACPECGSPPAAPSRKHA